MDKFSNVELAIWINGNEKFAVEMDRLASGLEAEKSKLSLEASKFHKKKIGAKEYWYMSGGKSGVWRYICTVRRNPIKKIESRIKTIERREERLKVRVNSAVVKTLGKHLLIDLERFKPSDGDCITSLELYEALRELRK